MNNTTLQAGIMRLMFRRLPSWWEPSALVWFRLRWGLAESRSIFTTETTPVKLSLGVGIYIFGVESCTHDITLAFCFCAYAYARGIPNRVGINTRLFTCWELMVVSFHSITPFPSFLPPLSFSYFTPSWSQQQYKFVYITIKHYVESQQALINVVSNDSGLWLAKTAFFTAGLHP